VHKDERELRIGELLQILGLVKKSQLNETLRLAVQAGLPLGRALIAAGFVTADELYVVLELQTLIRSGDLSLDESMSAFKLMTSEHATLSVALERIGRARVRQAPPDMSRLGTLLTDAQLLTQKQLQEAKKMSDTSGAPLDKALSLLGFIPSAVLARALELQTNIRDGKITYSEAVKKLGPKGSVRSLSTNLPQGFQNLTRRPRVRIVEMLILSGVLAEGDLMNSIDEALTTGKSLKDLLVETGALSADLVKLATELLQSINDGELDLQAAADALKYAATTDTALSGDLRPPPSLPSENIRLGDLLQIAGFVDFDDVQQALDLSAKYGSLIGKMLVISGAISEATLSASLRAQNLLRTGKLSCADAVRTLQYAERNKKEFDEALQDLDINPMPKPNGTIGSKSFHPEE